MGGCAAPYCNNSTVKGHTMKRFPKNPERRVIWIKNVNREDWVPTNNSLLCECYVRRDFSRKFSPLKFLSRTHYCAPYDSPACLH
ncbi:hypothetical protein ALC62_01964 [Cyphomyrmex costatus]|uniref:THAP-type domain-containing protein n=1 Tax=Cyphomyrmex costatus TaxID=456900 RepID=A0A151INR0_9HYME|nr:hypothetical protein ALC62_01964 [Cyphomyrmex costatus]